MSVRTIAGSRRLLVALVAASLAACSSSPTGVSGFLGDYSDFEEAPDRESAWIYRKPDADLREYDKLILDPVVLSPAPGSQLAKLEPSLAAARADELYKTLLTSVAPYHTVVLTSAPHTLRVRIALTEIALGSATAPGAVAIEGEIVDAKSGERIAAVVERVETPPASDPAAPVRAAFQTWAGRLVDFLEAHAGE